MTRAVQSYDNNATEGMKAHVNILLSSVMTMGSTSCKPPQDVLTLILPNSKKYILPTFLKEKCVSEAVRIGRIIIFHLSKLRKAKFFIMCGVIFQVRMKGEFEIDHSWD